MSEKLTPVSRALVAAAKMPAPQARRILMLICESGMTMDVPQPTQGEIHYSKREKFIKRMKSSCDRVLNYARHETLRKIEKHFRESPLKSSGGSPVGHPFRGNQYRKFGTSEGAPATLDEAMNTRKGAEWVKEHRFEFMADYLQHQTGRKSDLDLVNGYQVRRGKKGWDIINSTGAKLIEGATPEGLFDYARRGDLGYLTKKADDLRAEIVAYHKL